MSNDVVSALEEARVVPVATVDDAEQAVDTARALAAGGIHCIEIALRSESALEAIAAVATLGNVLVGAGTVLTAAQAKAAAAAGAAFAVAPNLDESVVEACDSLDLPFFAGAATPSEIGHARSLGLRTLKLFPIAQLGGPAFIRAVAAVYPDVRFLPTGGVTAAALGDYLAIPCVVACGGSWMVDRELLRAGRFDEVERLAKAAR